MTKFKPTSEEIQDAMIIYFCEGNEIEVLPAEIHEPKTYVYMKTYGSNAYEILDRPMQVGVFA